MMIQQLKNHWLGNVSYKRLIYLYYVIPRVIAVLYLPAINVISRMMQQEVSSELVANIAAVPFLLIVYSWVLLWKRRHTARSKYTKKIMTMIIGIEILITIWFVEFAQFA